MSDEILTRSSESAERALLAAAMRGCSATPPIEPSLSSMLIAPATAPGSGRASSSRISTYGDRAASTARLNPATPTFRSSPITRT